MTDFKYTVMQVVPRLDPGGSERTTLEISGAVAGAGGRSLVVTRGGFFEPEIKRSGGKVVHAPVESKNPFVIWNNAHLLAKLIGNEGVDVIHARSRAPAWSALLAARKTGIPFVTTYHGAYRSAGLFKQWYNSSMLRGDIVIANSGFTAGRILEGANTDPEKIRVIPRGVDLTLFRPEAAGSGRTENLERKWGISGHGNMFRLLLPARYTSWKGHHVAIEAIARIRKKVPDNAAAHAGKSRIRLVLCGAVQGRHQYVAELRKLAERHGLGDMVVFAGECTDMPAAYSWADAVIVPSTRPEAFGRVAIEAGAMERPVIAARHGGLEETVIDGQTGFLVPPGDISATANALLKVMKMSPRERYRTGANARTRIVARYSTDAMCRATLQVYDELCRKTPAGPYRTFPESNTQSGHGGTVLPDTGKHCRARLHAPAVQAPFPPAGNIH